MFVEKAKKMGRSVSFVAQLDRYVRTNVFSHSYSQCHSSLSYLTYVQEYI